MRPVTAQEAERWLSLAEEHGFTDDDGDIAIGRFRVARADASMITIRFITPIVAGLYTDDLHEKQPPVMFDRTASGEIIIPGRWWQHLFEQLSDDKQENDNVRAQAFRAAHGCINVGDGYLPADTDTIEFRVPDEDGRLVVHEALPPGGTISLQLNQMRG
jgi:hypothetical protein